MGRIAEIIRAVIAALASMPGKLVRGLKATTRWVGGQAITIMEDTWEWTRETAVPAVGHGVAALPGLAVRGALAAPGAALAGAAFTARLARAAVQDAALLPFRMLGKVKDAVFGGGGRGAAAAAASEQAVSEQAAQAEEIRQARVSAQRDQSEVLTALRRCSACKAVGKDAMDQDAARLPPELSALLERLTEEEAAIVARTPARDLQLYLAGKASVDGLRAPKDIVAGNASAAAAPARQQSPEAIAADIRARNRAGLRAQIRGERRARAANDVGIAA
jgi:hypothetical protein